MSETALAAATTAPVRGPLAYIALGDRQVTLLGTAHVSRTSAEEVRALLASGDYDAVAVELCPARHNALLNPDGLARMDLFQVIRSGKAPLVAANLALGAYQQRLAEQLGIEPGAEMRMAVNEGRRMGLPVLLIDRDIGVTLRRVYRQVPWWRRFYLLSGLAASLFTRERVSEAEVERLKEGDVLETAFSQFADQDADLYQPLIRERDRYMAARLRQALAEDPAPTRVLAVVGAGHLRGISERLQQPAGDPAAEIRELDQIPPRSRWPKLLPWLVVAIIMAGFALGFSRSPALGMSLVLDWVLINGGLAALGAAIAGGHPVTVLTAFLAAPLTSLNPTVGAGMVTAAVEVYLRKPQVGDFSRLRSDATTLGGWWHNRVTRTLLVFVLSTLGSAIGTYVAGFRIFERLTGS
jgi:pheromone shutdown-related protein TraB